MPKKTHAFGTEFKWDGEKVASLNNIGGMEINVDTVDVTTHDSEGGFKEFIAGLMDAGEVPISGYFNNENSNGQLKMVTDCTSREIKMAEIVFPESTGASWAFQGLITKIKVGDNPTNDGIPFSATIKVSGKPTLTIARSTGLSAMTLTGATLIPAFAAATLEYVATAAQATSSVKVTPTAGAGVIKVNGTIVTSGQASGDVTLGAAGSITNVVVEVKESDKAAKIYKIKVARAA